MSKGPYIFHQVYHNSQDMHVCEFCGCMVMGKYKDDHINWHETLDMQATMLMRRSLEGIQEDLQ